MSSDTSWSSNYFAKDENILPALSVDPKPEETLQAEASKSIKMEIKEEVDNESNTILKLLAHPSQPPEQHKDDDVRMVTKRSRKPYKRTFDCLLSFAEQAELFVFSMPSGPWEYECRLCHKFQSNQMRSVIDHAHTIHGACAPLKKRRFHDYVWYPQY